MKKPLPFRISSTRRRRGVALVIVLAFVVIVTGVIIAYFSRALSNRQISDASANQTKVALFAQGAADSVIANLQEEIILNSTATTVGSGTSTTTLYYPLTASALPPQMSGTKAAGISGTDWAPNFVARSANGQNFFNASTSGAKSSIASNAVAVSSTVPSINGRSISMARWNSHYLLPLTTTGTDSTPLSTAFAPPDWVLVARDGSNPTTNKPASTGATWSPTSHNTVIGRYAYVIYNEGGLLDANIAGFPTTTSTTTTAAYKPNLAYADLTQLPGGFNGTENQTRVDQFVAWRNAASAQPTQAFDASSSDPFGTGGNFVNSTNASGSNYFSYVTNNTNGFLSVSSTTLNDYSGNPNDTTAGESDHFFASRQQLISFLKNGLGFTGSDLTALNYLTTFSRGLNQPSYKPDPSRPKIVAGTSPNYDGANNATGLDNEINPSFLAVRVSGTGFVRNDGSTATPGEPLVKERFALSRLAWLTYLGPSADRNYTTPSATVGGRDYDLWQLENVYGVPKSYLAQGTDANIQKYFGLKWAVDSVPAVGGRGGATSVSFHDGEYKWFYSGHNETGQSATGQSTAGVITSATMGAISRMEDLPLMTGTSQREPDFFELLKAAVCAGSKAKGSMSLTSIYSVEGAYTHPYYYQTQRDTNLDYAIIQLGANIIDQAKVDGYATRIVYNNSTPTNSQPVREFRGVENLPYMYRFNSGTLKLRTENQPITATGEQDEPQSFLQDTGVGMFMVTPTIWNPHDALSPLGSPGPSGPAANFRLIADSAAPDSLGAVTSTNSSGYETFYVSGWENQTQGSTNPSSTQATGTIADTVYTTGPMKGGGSITPKMESLAAPGNPINPTNSAITFAVPNSLLFREPTPLSMANFPKNSLLSMSTARPINEYTLVMNTAGKTAWNGNGFLSDTPDPLNIPNVDTTGKTFVGICFGLYPIQWPGPTSSSAAPKGDIGVYQSIILALTYYTANGAPSGPYITCRLQYKDPNPADPTGSWVTYDEKYCAVRSQWLGTAFKSNPGNLTDFSDETPGSDWDTYIDPRTGRFGCIGGINEALGVQTPGGSAEAGEWSDATNGVGVTDRPDGNAGYSVTDDRTKGSTGGGVSQDQLSLLQDAATGWNTAVTWFRPGMLSQNNIAITDNDVRFAPGDSGMGAIGSETAPSNGKLDFYYADPDNVVRGAMGNYNPEGSNMPATGVVGLPMATAYRNSGAGGSVSTSGTYQGESRPYFLHRPFRSVGELGYVFSGTPWKNIDFFTPQSGDVALLDVFSAFEPPQPTANPQPLVAGVVDLNTRQAPVLAAILAGANVDEAVTSGTAKTPFQPFNASAVSAMTSPSDSASLIWRTSQPSTDGNGPLQNVSELVGHWDSQLGTYANGYSGPSGDLTNLYASAGSSLGSGSALQAMQYVDRFREAYIRPLAAVGNTRVWNLMIDLVAQTGRYPAGTSNAANFEVDGEQRYWIHVAIDRLTGQVLDKQVEIVRE